MENGISVVMAFFNGRQYINEQLKSIVNQSKPVGQIIILDDCSSDDCKDLIYRSLKDFSGEVIYCSHKINKGYAQTFFEALSMAKGEYIFLSDQDDIWYKNKVEACIQIMQSNQNILCLSSLNILINGDGKILKKEKKMGNKMLYEISAEELIRQTKLRPGMSLVLRKDMKKLLSKIDTKKFSQHDRLIEYIAVLRKAFFVLNKHLTCYRIHDSNTSGLNLSYFKPRTNKNGRLSQINKEVVYLELIRDIEPSYQNFIDKYIKYYNVRKELLVRSNIFLFLIRSLRICYGYIKFRVWLGDFRSILKG